MGLGKGVIFYDDVIWLLIFLASANDFAPVE